MILQEDQIQQYFSIYPTFSCCIALCLIPPGDQAVQHRFCTLSTVRKFLPYWVSFGIRAESHHKALGSIGIRVWRRGFSNFCKFHWQGGKLGV